VNIKVVLEYDGSGFAGWQQQAHGRTVEAELKQALREVTGAEHKVFAAGRTDAGAHAEGQVVSFETDGRIAPQRLVAALNARLPGDVSVLTAEVVPDGFHARYSARWRRYRYRYLDRRARPALARRWEARSMMARTSARPACTALSSSNAACERSATIRASVVLPDPGGP